MTGARPVAAPRTTNSVTVIARVVLAGLLAGAVVGWVDGLDRILENRYLSQGLSHLAARVLAAQVWAGAVAGVTFAAAGTGAVLVLWPAGWLFLGGRQRGLRGVALATVVAYFYARVGLWMNRDLLPGLFELPSVLANLGLTAVAAGVWWTVLRLTDRLTRWPIPRPVRWTTGWAPAVLAVLLVAGSQAGRFLAPPELETPRPEILILLVDALRADRLGVYGYHRDTSPHIDALARDGWTFTQATAPASWTKPSIASLFTSLYPHQHGIGSGSWSRIGTRGEIRVDALDAQLLTLAEILANGGYRTIAVGHNHHLTEQLGFAQGFDTYIWGLKDDETFTSAPEMHRRFLGWLDRHAHGFFAYLHYIDVHWPYLPPPPFAGRFSGPAPDVNYNEHDFIDTAQAAARRGDLDLDRDVLAHMSDSYDEQIQFVDAEIGKLVAELKSRGIYDSSLIIFTADHGEEFLEHGQLAHATSLYDVLLRVPLIIKFPCPGPHCATRTIGEQVDLIDLLPTLVAQAGLDRPEGIEGRNLAGPLPEPSPAYSERGEQVALRTVDHKYIYSLSSGAQELYELRSDPGEKTNTVREHPELARAYLEQLLEWVARTSRPGAGDRPGVVLDEETLRKLRALGYVE